MSVFFDAKAQPCCDEEVDNQAIVDAVVAFGIFIAYHTAFWYCLANAHVLAAQKALKYCRPVLC